MIANTAIFTCSICGEASSNICAYCTKDACSNHRCERCKRCSDCCECEVPLSAEEPALPQAEPALPQAEPVVAAEVEDQPALPEMPAETPLVLTVAESSVFVAGSVPAELVAPEVTESLDGEDAVDTMNLDEQ